MSAEAADTPEKPVVTREQLADALGRLGVVPRDVIFVHSSLKSLGHIDGGADGAVDALLSAVGPDGHVAVPTHCSGRIRDDRRPVFDPAATPSKTGAITEALRRRPGARRSVHPTHSIAAMGPAADLLVAGHDVDGRTLPLRGPHGRFVRWGAKIVFIGVGLGSNTTCHAVEDWLDLPFMPEGQALVAGPQGPVLIHLKTVPSGHRGFYRSNAEQPLNDRLFRGGLVRRVKLNRTPILMVSSRDVIRETCRFEIEQPGATLCWNPDCEFCREGRRLCVEHRDRIVARARELLARPELCDPAYPPDRGE